MRLVDNVISYFHHKSVRLKYNTIILSSYSLTLIWVGFLGVRFEVKTRLNYARNFKFDR